MSELGTQELIYVTNNQIKTAEKQVHTIKNSTASIKALTEINRAVILGAKGQLYAMDVLIIRLEQLTRHFENFSRIFVETFQGSIAELNWAEDIKKANDEHNKLTRLSKYRLKTIMDNLVGDVEDMQQSGEKVKKGFGLLTKDKVVNGLKHASSMFGNIAKSKLQTFALQSLGSIIEALLMPIDLLNPLLKGVVGMIKLGWVPVLELVMPYMGMAAEYLINLGLAVQDAGGWLIWIADGFWSITSIVSNMLPNLQNFSIVLSPINGVIMSVNGAFGSLEGGLTGLLWVAEAVKKGIKSVVNGLIKPVNDVIKWSNKHLKTDFKKIPKLGTGGTVYQPTVALIGEQGTEHVVRDDKMGTLVYEIRGMRQDMRTISRKNRVREFRL